MARTQVRRRRAVLVAAILAAGMSFVGGRASASQQHGAPQRLYVVRAGDTLWGIARQVVGPGGDPRPVVQQLADRNGLTDGMITVGERLVLPTG